MQFNPWTREPTTHSPGHGPRESVGRGACHWCALQSIESEVAPLTPMEAVSAIRETRKLFMKWEIGEKDNVYKHLRRWAFISIETAPVITYYHSRYYHTRREFRSERRWQYMPRWKIRNQKQHWLCCLLHWGRDSRKRCSNNGKHESSIRKVKIFHVSSRVITSAIQAINHSNSILRARRTVQDLQGKIKHTWGRNGWCVPGVAASIINTKQWIFSMS